MNGHNFTWAHEFGVLFFGANIAAARDTVPSRGALRAVQIGSCLTFPWQPRDAPVNEDRGAAAEESSSASS